MNELIFNGKNFTEFNAYYATSNFLDGAAKDVQSVSVVGRSGDLQLSNNRYKNLSLKIRVYVTRDMEASMRAMRNYLESVHGYARVEISDQPNEYRMAAYKEMFAPDSYDPKVGVVDLTFDSMPQRFLKSGETTTSVSSSSSEISGNPVQIDKPSGLTALTGLSVDIEPVQSGSGDPSPTNIRPITGHTSATVTRTGRNLIDLAGTFTSVQYSSPVTLPAGEYYVYVFNSLDEHGYNSFFKYFDGTGFANFSTTPNEYGYVDAQMSYNRKKCKVTLNKACTVRQVLQVNSATSGATFAVMLTKDGSNYASVPNNPPYSRLSELYEPYQGQTVTINLNGTVYGGTLDVLTGVLTVTDENIASYNGETLPSTWISDRDVYASGTTPTTGAQVVYKLATPTTVQLTAQQVSLLTGTNIISTDMESVTVTISSPAELENPTLFESKPLIRVYGNGTLNVNDIYITVANSPYTYIDIDCELMDCYHGSNNANQYVSFSTTDYVTLRSGMNYFSYSGFTQVEVTPRWFEI